MTVETEDWERRMILEKEAWRAPSAEDVEAEIRAINTREAKQAKKYARAAEKRRATIARRKAAVGGAA